jgi:phosphatidylserine/phosphatidylglycerophosphate/cardiolipin synthase-like enzyme
MTLMWIQVATGFTGALALVYLARTLLRKLGFVLDVRAYFSPKGGGQEAIVAALSGARKEILVQAYAFAAEPLAKALVAAKERGVHVDIVLDPGNEKDRPSDLGTFLEHALDVRLDADHRAARGQVIIIDGRTVITGSSPFTTEAEDEEAGSLLIIKGHPDLPRFYRESFLQHKAHSTPAQAKDEAKERVQHKAAA